MLRFDDKDKESDEPFPSERYSFIAEQDLEFWISPKYCNNQDSSYFQNDEKENTPFVKFSKENRMQEEKVGLLQNEKLHI